jgi:peptidyl-prolyl cis-trans isomerase SurA
MISLNILTRTFLVLSLVLLAILPLAVQAKVFDKVVAKVNTEIITLSSVEERGDLLRNKYAQSPLNIPQQELLMEALNMIIEERLQLQEGKKMGFIVDEDSIDAAVKSISQKNGIEEDQLLEILELEGRTLTSYRNKIRDQIMVSKISRFEIGSRIKVSDKEINDFYNDHQKDFWEDGKVRARHILFITEAGSSEEVRGQKLKQAKNILKKIKKGGDFAELAMKYSEDVSAGDGGDVGYVTKGKMVPQFEEAVFSLKLGQVSDIVETDYGYHIIKIEEIIAGKTLTLKDAKDRISQIISMGKQKHVYEDWMRELKGSAFIEVSLFAEPDKNKSVYSKDLRGGETVVDVSRKNKSNAEADSRKQILQKKWEEMYKSVESSRDSSEKKDGSQFDSLKEKLEYIKKLRNRNTISEHEYQVRKEKILSRL